MGLILLFSDFTAAGLFPSKSNIHEVYQTMENLTNIPDAGQTLITIIYCEIRAKRGKRG